MRTTILDRAIAYVSPSLARQRMQDRLTLHALDRIARQSYDGASTGRRTDGWITTGTSANAENLPAQQRLRNRARDLARNNPLIRNALRRIRDNAVGTGITVEWADRDLQAVWDRWVEYADADGKLCHYAQQGLIAGAIPESGDVLIRFRPRPSSDGFEVPLQIQVLESDYLDTSKDGSIRTGVIRSGIEFDMLGRRKAYHLFRAHPGDTGVFLYSNLESSRVPASEVLHPFVMDRPGQVTGITWLASVMIRARDVADYDDAELFRKKIEACNVGAVTQTGGIGSSPLGPAPAGLTGVSDPQNEQFEPGTFVYFPDGAKVEFNDPKGNTAYAPYMREQNHAIGAGVGVPYMSLTGDLSQSNYTSMRGGRLEFHQSILGFRQHTLIDQAFAPIVKRFAEVAVMAGRTTQAAVDQGFVMHAPPFQEVDPGKESIARERDVRNGFKTAADVIGEGGHNWKTQLQRINAWNEELDRLGIVLDSDPRNVTRAGQVQTDPDPVPEKEEE